MTTERLHTPEAQQARRESSASVKTAGGLRQRLRADIEAGRQAKIIDRALEMPLTHRNRYLAAVNGNLRESAIRAFCAECVGWIRAEVAQCTSLACPLYSYRPYQPGEEFDDD